MVDGGPQAEPWQTVEVVAAGGPMWIWPVSWNRISLEPQNKVVRPEVEAVAGKPLGGVLHPLIGVDAPGDPQDVHAREQKPVLLGLCGLNSCAEDLAGGQHDQEVDAAVQDQSKAV